MKHDTSVRKEQGGDRHRAICSCGWEDERAYSRPAPAENAALEHRNSEESK